MRSLLFFIIFIFSLAVQISLNQLFVRWNFPLPLIIITTLIIFWHVSLPFRLWFSLAAGIILDDISFLPFGTYTALLAGAAFAVEILKNVFSSVESRLVEGLSICVLLITIFGFLHLLKYVFLV